jgi:hypothetical protein
MDVGVAFMHDCFAYLQCCQKYRIVLPFALNLETADHDKSSVGELGKQNFLCLECKHAYFHSPREIRLDVPEKLDEIQVICQKAVYLFSVSCDKPNCFGLIESHVVLPTESSRKIIEDVLPEIFYRHTACTFNHVKTGRIGSPVLEGFYPDPAWDGRLWPETQS